MCDRSYDDVKIRQRRCTMSRFASSTVNRESCRIVLMPVAILGRMSVGEKSCVKPDEPTIAAPPKGSCET